MTRRTSRGEEGLARLRVADDDARRPVSGFVVAGGAEAVDEGGDVFYLIIVERELGHARAAAPHDGRNALAVLVLEHNRGAEQARPAVAAAGVGAVAELTIHAIQRLASPDCFRIARRARGIGIPR